MPHAPPPQLPPVARIAVHKPLLLLLLLISGLLTGLLITGFPVPASTEDFRRLYPPLYILAPSVVMVLGILLLDVIRHAIYLPPAAGKTIKLRFAARLAGTVLLLCGYALSLVLFFTWSSLETYLGLLIALFVIYSARISNDEMIHIIGRPVLTFRRLLVDGVRNLRWAWTRVQANAGFDKAWYQAGDYLYFHYADRLTFRSDTTYRVHLRLASEIMTKTKQGRYINANRILYKDLKTVDGYALNQGVDFRLPDLVAGVPSMGSWTRKAEEIRFWEVVVQDVDRPYARRFLFEVR